MLKRTITILMSALILLTAFQDAALYLGFKFNQNYIAKNLCVDKNRPQSSCQGKCMLTKTITERHEQKDELPLPFTFENKGQTTQFLNLTKRQTFEFNDTFIANKPVFSFQRLTSQPVNFDIFHPPRFI